jgi:hypothetical protein
MKEKEKIDILNNKDSSKPEDWKFADKKSFGWGSSKKKNKNSKKGWQEDKEKKKEKRKTMKSIKHKRLMNIPLDEKEQNVVDYYKRFGKEI